MRPIALLRLLLHLCPGAHAAPARDRVHEMPGWSAQLFSATYAGYVSAGDEDGYVMKEHYMFFESEGDPRTDPIILWSNGGPGASSLEGAFTEAIGPYSLSYASMQTPGFHTSGVPSLFENPFRWTKFGSLLVINSPPPVGFSFCLPAGPSGGPESCGAWNDTKVAKHNLEFLNNWFDGFPEYRRHDLYLVGESYAGIYIPTLVQAILADGDSQLGTALQGFALMDACLGGGNGCKPWSGPLFSVEFYHGHGQFSSRTYRLILKTCTEDELLNGPIKTPACEEALNQMHKERGYNYPYDLYDECYDDFPFERPANVSSMNHMDGSPCGGLEVLPVWVNQSAVRQELHVEQDARFFLHDPRNELGYKSTTPNLIPFYKYVASETHLRTLVMSGDADPAINSFFAEYWTSLVGQPELESWRPWTLDGKVRMGGYVTRYAGDFDFVTVRGAGHMVPQYKPAAAFALMKAWLFNHSLPAYNPPSGLEKGQQPTRQPGQKKDATSKVIRLFE